MLNVLFDERVGGPQLRVLQVARHLRQRGVVTHVVIPKGDPQFASMLSEGEIPCHELSLVRLRQTFRPLPHLRYPVQFWPNVRALRRLIRRHQISIVHANGILSLQAAIAARLERVPLVWHLNDVLTPKPMRSVLRLVVRAWAKQIAVAARAVGEYYFQSPNSLNGRLKVLYAPVDTAYFNPFVDGSPVREEFGVADNQVLIGTVGNLDPVKGHRHFVEAAAIIKKRYSRAKFLLVGQRLENRKKYGETLVQRTEALGMRDHVFFAGRRDDMPATYRAMDLYVHPSESEACPMAVLEASASGIPVIATDVGGVREVVSDNETGIVIGASDPMQIADAVRRLLENPDLACKMRQAGVRRMQHMFSLEACVDQHFRIYEAALQ